MDAQKPLNNSKLHLNSFRGGIFAYNFLDFLDAWKQPDLGHCLAQNHRSMDKEARGKWNVKAKNTPLLSNFLNL